MISKILDIHTQSAWESHTSKTTDLVSSSINELVSRIGLRTPEGALHFSRCYKKKWAYLDVSKSLKEVKSSNNQFDVQNKQRLYQVTMV